jgi:hypothetical protein
MRMTRARVQRLAIAASLLALAGGCTSAMSKREHWEGHRISELIARRGPADRIEPYPYGGTLYIWEKPASSFEADRATMLDEGSALAGFVQRQLVLVSDAGIIMESKVKTEPLGAP